MAPPLESDDATIDSTHPMSGARIRRPVIPAFVMVAAVVVAMVAGWTLSERTARLDGELPPDVERLLDDYLAALNDWDREAYLSLVTADAVHRTPSASRTANVHAGFVEDFRVIDLHLTPIGEPIVHGDGPWYVAQAVQITATTYTEERGGIMTLTIVDDDGRPKVSRHVYSGSRGPA